MTFSQVAASLLFGLLSVALPLIAFVATVGLVVYVIRRLESKN
jgi:hypothetical protein